MVDPDVVAEGIARMEVGEGLHFSTNKESSEISIS